MLSISKPIKGSAQCEYYLNLASRDDYYLDAEEPPGFWLGDGANALGLEGQVDEEAFRNLFRGFSPDGEKTLVRNAQSKGRRCGWDLTWSAPKSVSTIWSQASAPVREEIEAALKGAVGEGVAYLAGVGAVSRRGENGVVRDRAELLLAAFPHSTSRAQDPQLHVHTLLLNLGIRPDGSVGTLDPRELFRHQHAAGAIFRAELAAQLEKRLGLRAVREGRSFEILGVDQGLMDTFSKRRHEIVAALKDKGLSGAKAAEVAAFATRSKKAHIPRAELFESWHAIGREHHWTSRNVEHLVHAPFPVRDERREGKEAGQQALSALTAHDSHFSTRRLTQTLAEEAQGRGLSAKDILQIRYDLLNRRELIPVGRKAGEDQFSTPEMVQIEKALLAAAEKLHAAEVLVPGTELLAENILSKHPELTSEQVEIVQAVTGSLGGLHLVSGMAGTGKTFSFRVAREAWEAEGLTVLGASLSGKAAAGLQEGSGIPSQTLHRLLWGVQHGAIILGPHSVVLVDEAAMVGTRQLRGIVEACGQTGAKLVLAGDAAQLQAIEAGGGFSALSRDYGATRLTDIRRQREEWAREAVHDFAAGRSLDGLTAHAERERVQLSPSATLAESRLVADWSQRAAANPAGKIILAGTNAEVTRLNAMAQEIRRSAGVVHGEALDVADTPIYLGDRVLFTRNSQKLMVFNGEIGTVTSRSGTTLTIQIDGGRAVSVDASQYPHLTLAYALTTHKSQGMTVQEAFILTGSMQNRELTYVQASRAREASRFYVGGESIERVAERMERSQPKVMASRLNETAELSLQLDLRR